MAAKYASVDEEIRRAKTAAQAAAAPSAPQNKPAEIDPETRKSLEQLRREVAVAAAAEERNAGEAQRLSGELRHLADQAQQQQMTPPEMLAEFRAVQKTFDRSAAQPMRQLAAEMKQEAASKQPESPPLADWQQRGGRLREELQSLSQRLKALEEAKKQLMSGAEEALANLQKELLQEEARQAARELGELRDMMAGMQKDLQQLEGRQAESLDAARAAHEAALPELAKTQDALERQEAGPLAEAGNLLQQEGPRRMKQGAQSAEAPNPAEGEAEAAPPHEQGAATPPAATAAGKAGAKDSPKDAAKNEAIAEARLYEPVLGGPPPKLDAKLAEKRPAPKKAETPSATPAPPDRREELNAQTVSKADRIGLGAAKPWIRSSVAR